MAHNTGFSAVKARPDILLRFVHEMGMPSVILTECFLLQAGEVFQLLLLSLPRDHN